MALRLKYKYPKYNVQDLIHLCGYYDQSHFTRDFKQFSGKTPYEYFVKNKRNVEAGGIFA
jgi:AraC-like DNA-binding protein